MCMTKIMTLRQSTPGRLFVWTLAVMLLAFLPGIMVWAQPGYGWFCKPLSSSGCLPPCTTNSYYECEYFPVWTIGYCDLGGTKTCTDQYFDCGMLFICVGIPTMQPCSTTTTCYDY